jgi:hypothetical protein
MRREKAGSKSAAIDLVRKRKTDPVEGKKLPKKLRRATGYFADIDRATRHKPAGTRSDFGYTTSLANTKPETPTQRPGIGARQVRAHAVR